MRNKNTLYLLCALGVMLVTLYIFPRHTTNPYYNAEVGKAWPYESLTAKCDFPIIKTQKQLEADREEKLRAEYLPCYSYRSGRVLGDTISLSDYIDLESKGYQKIYVMVGSNERKAKSLRVIASSYRDEDVTLREDTMASRLWREALLEAVSESSGMVQKGDKIIDRGEKVTERDMQVLESMRRAYEQDELTFRQQVICAVGDGVIVMIFMLLFVLYLHVFCPDYILRLRRVLFFCLLPLLMIVLSCLEVRYTTWSIYLIPLAWIPVLTRIFFDSRTAFFLHVVTVMIISLVVENPYEFVLLQVAVGAVAVLSMRDLTRRSQLFHTAMLIMATYMLVYTAYCMARTGGLVDTSATTYLYFFINALLVVCSYAMIYFFERAFDLMSGITLVELTDFSSELLRRFSELAPGSFQHSIQVSNLATEAAKAIGADSLLVRTGAMYHDVGKMAHPNYYTENQQDDQNPLLGLSNLEATRVIVSHVSEGLSLARHYHLPDGIQQFILTHHGTSLVRYFYNTAVNNGENPVESDYRYPGTKPQTKEEAIVMMADAVEARSRSLKNVNEEALAKMVDQMIDTQVADGQFSEANITFRDVTTIKRVFVQHMLVMNHHRVKYPTIKK